jgi:peptidoglycan/xylan/chitin deacetylase (PgdA/CDA1 family)
VGSIPRSLRMSDTPSLPPRTAWRASPLLRASALLHVGAAVATAVRPQWWPWALGTVIANHLQLTATGLWPRSTALGSNWTALPPAAAARGEVAITIDDGPDPEVTPQVLRILAAHGAHATFFCIGERAERFPDCVRACVTAGHAIENHSQHHAHRFSLLGPAAMRREIERAQHAIEQVCGARPLFFRAPAGLRNPFLDPVLHRLQLQLASWTRRGFDTVNADPQAVFDRLIDNLRGGDILLLHDGHAARSPGGVPIILEVLPRLLQVIAARSLRPVTLRAARR